MNGLPMTDWNFLCRKWIVLKSRWIDIFVWPHFLLSLRSRCLSAPRLKRSAFAMVIYLPWADVHVAELHQPSDHFHVAGVVGCCEWGQHHCCVTCFILEVNFANSCVASRGHFSLFSFVLLPIHHKDMSYRCPAAGWQCRICNGKCCNGGLCCRYRRPGWWGRPKVMELPF